MAKIDPSKLKKQINKSRTTKKTGADALKAGLGQSGIGKTKRGGGISSIIKGNPNEVAKELAQHFLMIPIDKISTNKYQPRQDFDEKALQDLSNSIKEFGVIQPITVKADEKYEHFQIISGERRWRASKMAGLKEIPAYIRTPNDQELAEMALVENLFRENLNPLEIAHTYARLMEEFKLTQEDLAKRVEKGRTTITNFLRALKLGDFAKQQLRAGKISMGHAKALLGIDDVVTQRIVCEEVIKRDLSVRATEQLSSQYKGPGAKSAKKAKKPSKSASLSAEHTKSLDMLKDRFGSGKVRLEIDKKGKGQIVVPFSSSDELEDILDQLR